MIDRDGMAVSNTYTLEGGYGSRVVVKGAGFLLNNEMGDFNKNPGVTLPDGTIGTPANLIDPGKRMLSSMTPTIVSKDGKVVLITGSPGGRTIINTVFTRRARGHRVRHERARRGRRAAAAPPVDARHGRRIERAGARPRSSLAKLTGDGTHGDRRGGGQGDANSIGVDAGGTAWGASDKRSPDGKASVAALDFDRGDGNRLSRRCSVSRTTTGTIIPASAGRSSCATDLYDNHQRFLEAPPDQPAGLFFVRTADADYASHGCTEYTEGIWIFRSSRG